MLFIGPVLLHAQLTRLALTLLASSYHSQISQVVVFRSWRDGHAFQDPIHHFGRRHKIYSFWFVKVFWYSLNSYFFSDVAVIIRLGFRLCPNMGVACLFWLSPHDYSVALVYFAACCDDSVYFFCARMLLLLYPFSENVQFFPANPLPFYHSISQMCGLLKSSHVHYCPRSCCEVALQGVPSLWCHWLPHERALCNLVLDARAHWRMHRRTFWY